MKKHKTRDYEDDLIEKLKDSEFAMEYLNVALENQEKGAQERFLLALRQLAHETINGITK